MAEHYSFFDAVQDSNGNYDREYNAQEFTDYFGDLITTGVMKGAFNQLEVTTNGTNMVSSINTGVAFVEGKRYFNDSSLELTHDTETLGKSRIDRIVIRMSLDTEARYVRAFIKKGVASTSPVAPTLTQTANLYEISLAQVRIVGGQTFIATNAVLDERGTDIICPWAGSNILPNFNDAALEELVEGIETHTKNIGLHTPLVPTTYTDNGSYILLTGNIPGTTEGEITLQKGMSVSVEINYRSATTETAVYYLNLNGTGLKYLLKPDLGLFSCKDVPNVNPSISNNIIVTLRYNGSYWVIQGEPHRIQSYTNLPTWTGWGADSYLQIKKNLYSETVNLRGGFVKTSTSTQILCQLPEGFRPSARLPINVILAPSGTYKNCDAYIMENGLITIYNTTEISQTPNNTVCYVDVVFALA